MYEDTPLDKESFKKMYNALFDGKLIQGTGQHEINLYLNGSKHTFPNWDAFVDSGYDYEDVKTIPTSSIYALKTGEAVDPSNVYYHKEKIAQMKSKLVKNTAAVPARWASEKDPYGEAVGASSAKDTRAGISRGKVKGHILPRRLRRRRMLQGKPATAAGSGAGISTADKGRSMRRGLRARDARSSVTDNKRQLKMYTKEHPDHPQEDILSPTKKNHYHYGAEELTDEQRTVVLTKRVEAAMIFDKLNASEVKLLGNRKHNNSVHFMQTLLNHKDNALYVTMDIPPLSAEGGKYMPVQDAELFKFKAWPGVFTGDCPGYFPEARQDHSPGADRGMILAHRAIWEEFVSSREISAERLKIDEKDDIMLVFEDDPYPLVENHQLNTLREINRMKSDLHWLGWCYHHEYPFRSPLCMHAYAMSVVGARSLLKSIKPCGPLPLDRQVRLMCDGNTTWSLTDGEFEYRTHHSDFFRNRMSDAGTYIYIRIDTHQSFMSCIFCMFRMFLCLVCLICLMSIVPCMSYAPHTQVIRNR